MASSLELPADQFTLSGGKLLKPVLATGATTVDGHKYITLKKDAWWLTWFLAGCGPQQSPLTHIKLLTSIRDQHRAHMQEALADTGVAGKDEDELDDLDDKLNIEEIGLSAVSTTGSALTKKNLAKLGATVNTVLDIAGAKPGWIATCVVENTKSVRMQLTHANLDNLFAAYVEEASKLVSTATHKKKVRKLPGSPKTPKQVATYLIKGKGLCQRERLDGKPGKGFRTPRRMIVINRKYKSRRHGVSASDNTVATDTGSGILDVVDVLASDDMSKLDE